MFHNLSLYDGHFVLQFFRKEYTTYTTWTGTKAYADVGVIPLNGECNMLLKICSIVFVDSCQFLATSLHNLVKTLRKSGVDKFANTIRHFGDNDNAYFEKGCYPYEYMTDESKLDETELLSKLAFYNRLVGKELRHTRHPTGDGLRRTAAVCARQGDSGVGVSSDSASISTIIKGRTPLHCSSVTIGHDEEKNVEL